MTTVCFVADPNFVIKHEGTFDGKVIAVKIPKSRSIDIDTSFDFEFAEYLMRKSRDSK